MLNKKTLITNLEIIKAYQNALWEDKNLEAIEEFLDKNVLIHSAVKSTKGIEEMKSIISQWHIGFPDLKVCWDDFICDGDKIASRWHAEGLQKGEFLKNPPSKKNIKYSGVTLYHLNNGKIVEYWSFIDMHGILTQLLNQ